MSTAMFIRHKCRPGKRDEVQRLWEKYMKPRVADNPGHQAYYYCYDQNEPDTISIFQVGVDSDAFKRFLEGEWYPAFLNELRPLSAERPRVVTCDVIWSRG